VAEIKKELKAKLPEGDEAAADKLENYYEVLRERLFREQVTKDRLRPDRRKFDEIRPITIETGALPRTHGSAIFTRGETQALVTTTLGTSEDVQRLENFEGEKKKNFMLHYNFPPFSVGETGRMTGVGRREVGHGALAERAITAILPDETAWPYTMRVVSDILESNGSSSMASVCGAALSLMDAGVPIKAPVAGIAMGLVKEGDDYSILTDIAGAEDHYGDMDFKSPAHGRELPRCRWISRSPALLERSCAKRWNRRARAGSSFWTKCRRLCRKHALPSRNLRRVFTRCKFLSIRFAISSAPEAR